MPHTYSLADPPLQEHSLVGPVVRMRWMSNLFRLAFLEEADRKSVSDGRDPRHQAEIRRLRRTSMAPGAGRHYPVADDEDPDDFLSPEEARQLVEIWRSRQPLPEYSDAESDYDDESASPLTPAWPERSRRAPSTLAHDDDDWDEDDPDEQLRPPSDLRGGRPRAVVTYPYDDDPRDFEDSDEWAAGDVREGSDGDDPQPWSADEYSLNRHEAGRAQASRPLITSSHHLLINYPDEEEPTSGGASRFTAWVTIMLLAALLGMAARWFIDAYLLSPRRQPAQVEVLDTTKIVPSAVPRESSDIAAAQRLAGLGSCTLRLLDPCPRRIPSPPD